MLEGIFKGLHRRSARPVADDSASEGLRLLLHGQESYPLELVGTSRRQAEIRAIAEQKARIDRHHRCMAVLAVDETGPFGKANVGVFVEGELVGYLPRYFSTQYREWLGAWKLSRANVHCRAIILSACGKAEAGGGEHRVKIDVETPFRMTTLQV